MHLESLRNEFRKMYIDDGLQFSIGSPATDDSIAQAEMRLRVTLPAQVRMFYEHCNGLRVAQPSLKIFPLEELHFVTPNRLHFSEILNEHSFYFDTSRINEAEQWDIFGGKGYLVTKTMASFWSNKIWAWIRDGREIWKDGSNEKLNPSDQGHLQSIP